MLAGLALLTRPQDGTLSRTAVGLLAPHLTDENHVQILDAARHKTKREVTPLAPQRFKLQLTISGATPDKLRRIRDLLRDGYGYSARSSVYPPALE